MSIQSDLLKTAGGIATAVGSITGALDDEDPEKEAGALAIRGKAQKQPLRQQLEEANKRAEDALATAQLQKHQTARVKGLYGARKKALMKEINQLKAENELLKGGNE